VEAAIATGVVNRPVIKFNGDLIWKWPEPHAIPGEEPQK
jgi:hypothetical protein